MSTLTRRLLPALTLPVVLAGGLAPAQAQPTIPAPTRTAISIDHTPTRLHLGTANEHESRPALSLIKLYLADWVLSHGAPEDAADALALIRTSDDAAATRLHARYPGAIAATAAYYGLHSTHAAAHWGNSTTSTFDVNRFLVAKMTTDPDSPVLQAMREVAPVAADGYPQDFGTATLPMIEGTKFGWSDDRTSIHATASIGPGLVVSAHTYGTAAEHTRDIALH